MAKSPSRFEELDPEKMDADQRRIYDRLISGRGKLPGPYRVWLENPAFSDIGDRLGTYMRADSKLSDRLREMAILVTTRHWRAQYAWHSHARSAQEAGIDAAVVEAIRDRKAPVFENEDEAAVYAFARESLEDREISDDTWKRVNAALGADGLIDLIGLMGFYCMVGFTVNAFEFPPAGGAPPELPD